MSDSITIRAITSIEEIEHFQRLEQLIWQSPPDELMPVHMVITAIHNGGGLLGAFAEEGPAETGGMIGLAFWFPGLGVPTTQPWRGTRRETGTAPQAPSSEGALQLKMCSHMVGVLPGWQGRGLGVQLKQAQRQAILAQGMTDWVTWTYDPLFRVNGVLNIHRLGAVCNTYRRNWYGIMKDGINAGLPSDRCQVDWWIASERVQRRLAAGSRSRGIERSTTPTVLPGKLHIVPTRPAGSRFRVPVEVELPLDGRPLALPIPDDIADIRRTDPPLGMAWRMAMRAYLEQAFQAGYVMTDCVHLPDQGWHYVLEMQPGDGEAVTT
uniref:N-acetyltransferase domain-containing protein n=1 Tax=Caldilinea aerophila TaxID=133453 RepID=A0A7C1J9C0_9CHLR